MINSGLCVTELDGALSWRSDAGPTVALATVQLPGGFTFATDVTDPDSVLVWALPAGGGAMAELTSVVDDVDLLAEVAEFRLAGPSSRQLRAPAALKPGWARVSVVEAVDRWMLQCIDPVPLTIDRALAWLDVGHRDVAARLLWQVSGCVVELAHRVLHGELTGGAVADVKAAVDAGAELLPPGESDRTELIEIQRALDIADANLSSKVDIKDFDEALRTLLNRELAGIRFKGRKGTETVPSGPGTLYAGAHFVDPTLVSPRTLAWRGAAEPELMSSYEEGAAAVQISVKLASSALPEDQEAKSIIAFAALSESGQPWSSVQLVAAASGTALLADLPLHGQAPDDLTFGVYQMGNADIVRADKTGQALTMVDRCLIDSWNVARLAQVVAVDVNQMLPQPTTKWGQDRAEFLALKARRSLLDLASSLALANATMGPDAGRSTAYVSHDDLTLVARRRDRVLAYCDSLEESTYTVTSTSRPLLAETLLLLDGPVVVDRSV